VPKWRQLLMESNAWQGNQEEIVDLLQKLEQRICLGKDKSIADRLDHLPEDLKVLWSRIAYVEFNGNKLTVLEDILKLLNHPALDIPHKYQSKRILTALKALAEIIPEIEDRANRIMLSLKNGSTFSVCEH
jgi:chromosome condensin MukBEF ATPase and DNA-binding subunit MukB